MKYHETLTFVMATQRDIKETFNIFPDKTFIKMCAFQECPCLVDKDFLASLESVSITPVSSLLLHNVTEGGELQPGDTLVHDCSTW